MRCVLYDCTEQATVVTSSGASACEQCRNKVDRCNEPGCPRLASCHDHEGHWCLTHFSRPTNTWKPGESGMLYTPNNHGSFKCQCGCNVFTKTKEENTYTCNGCRAVWTGTPIDQETTGDHST